MIQAEKQIPKDVAKKFRMQAFYSIGVLCLASSVFVTFAESFNSGRIFFNRIAWDGSIWDQRESLFVLLGVASFIFLTMAYSELKKPDFFLNASAYIAVIVGSPDAFRAYNGLIWNSLREWNEIWFAIAASFFLAYNVWRFRKVARHG